MVVSWRTMIANAANRTIAREAKELLGGLAAALATQCCNPQICQRICWKTATVYLRAKAPAELAQNNFFQFDGGYGDGIGHVPMRWKPTNRTRALPGEADRNPKMNK